MMNKIKIICTQEQYQNILEVWCCGCCWIGTGENNPHDARNTRYKMKKVDIEKFKMASDLLSQKNVEFEFIKNG